MTNESTAPRTENISPKALPRRLAVVVGISSYSLPTQSLPACRADAASIDALLAATGAFHDRLLLLEGTNSSVVKESLRNFVARNNSHPVDEFFFYFSGHGHYSGDEFFYLLSDYSESRLRVTSLENSELDGLVRSLSPRLTIKVVDACNSGVPYIKGAPDLQRHLSKAAQDHLSNCYFLFASPRDGYAYQDSTLSYFTRSFLRSVADAPSDLVRYKDIIDSISDDAELRRIQSPFFVTQADYTEVFCEAVDSVRSAAVATLERRPAPTPTTPQSVSVHSSVAAALAADIDGFFTQADAESYFAAIDKILTTATVPTALASHYSATASRVSNATQIPKASALGDWLDKASTDWFASPVRTQRWVPTGRRSGYASIFGDNGYYEEDITGFQSTVKFQALAHVLAAKSNHQALDTHELYIVPFFSPRAAAVHTICSRRRWTSWSNTRLEPEYSWESETFERNQLDRLEAFLEATIARLWRRILEPLALRLEVDIEELLNRG